MYLIERMYLTPKIKVVITTLLQVTCHKNKLFNIKQINNRHR